jgi:hypothetical protein
MAIKKIPINHEIEIKREVQAITDLGHENIVVYYFREADQRFEYLGFSLCIGHFGDVTKALNHFTKVSKCPDVFSAQRVPMIPDVFLNPAKRDLIQVIRAKIREQGLQPFVFSLMHGAVKGLQYIHS